MFHKGTTEQKTWKIIGTIYLIMIAKVITEHPSQMS